MKHIKLYEQFLNESSTKQKIIDLFKTNDRENIMLGFMLIQGQNIKFKGFIQV